MWEFLKSKNRKERELLEKERKQAEFIQLKKEYSETVARLNKKLSDASYKSAEAGRERVKLANSICPKCGSKKIIDKISQIKGDLNGSSYGSGSLFSHSSYGSIHGSLDTLEVNKCSDCEHEWKKTKYSSYYESISDKLRRLRYSLETFNECYNCKFDPKDLTETYDSLEDKKIGLLTKTRGNYSTTESKEFFSGVRIDVLKLIVEEEYKMSYQDTDKKLFLKSFNENILINELGFVK